MFFKGKSIEKIKKKKYIKGTYNVFNIIQLR